MQGEFDYIKYCLKKYYWLSERKNKKSCSFSFPLTSFFFLFIKTDKEGYLLMMKQMTKGFMKPKDLKEDAHNTELNACYNPTQWKLDNMFMHIAQ